MKKLLVYGLQRSGTNYLEKLLATNFKELELKNNAYARSLPLHKHFRPYDEKYLVPEPKYLNSFQYPSFQHFEQHVEKILNESVDGYVVIIKEPYSWYISYCNLAKKTGWKSYMKKWVNNHYILEYNAFCKKWLDFAREAPERVLILRYEDMLKDLTGNLQKIQSQFNLTSKGDDFKNLEKVPMSKKFSKKRKKYYAHGDFTSQFSDDELLVITENFDHEVIKTLGYEIVKR